MALRIEVLGRQHRSLLKGFNNQHASLVEYLQRFALRHAEKDLLSRTFLAIDEQDGEPRVAGYFSLAPVSVDRASLGGVSTLDRLPRFPIPGILLARLAVDERVQGQGLGRYLFGEALGRTLQLVQTGPVVFRLFVTDAIDAPAVGFYERIGLARLGDIYPCRMVLDLRPLLSDMIRPNKPPGGFSR
jgi:GNAT superfamily N-acetyltransferase